MNLTPWSTEQPTLTGWYIASTCEPRVADFFRHWNGTQWSAPVHREDMNDPVRLARARTSRGETQDDVVWQALDLDALDDDALETLSDDLWAADAKEEAEAKPVTRESALASVRFAQEMMSLVLYRRQRLMDGATPR